MCSFVIEGSRYIIGIFFFVVFDFKLFECFEIFCNIRNCNLFFMFCVGWVWYLCGIYVDRLGIVM